MILSWSKRAGLIINEDEKYIIYGISNNKNFFIYRKHIIFAHYIRTIK